MHLLMVRLCSNEQDSMLMKRTNMTLVNKRTHLKRTHEYLNANAKKPSKKFQTPTSEEEENPQWRTKKN